MENGNGECAKETTTRPQNRHQQKVTRSSMQRETPVPGGVLQLAPKQNKYLYYFSDNIKLI